MAKLQLYAIALLLAVSAVLGFGLWRSVSANGALRVERDTATEALNRAAEQRKRDADTLAARARENAATGRKYRQAQEALSEALQRDPVWSEADVPPEVLRALSDRSGGSNVKAE